MKRTGKKQPRQDRAFVARRIRDIRAAAGMLEAYFKMTKRQHRRLNLGNGCYDPVNYWTQQVMSAAANLRQAVEDGERFGITLADGSVLAARGGRGNSRGKPPAIPVKYLTAVARNPDGSLTPEELKIRYMNLDSSGR